MQLFEHLDKADTQTVDLRVSERICHAAWTLIDADVVQDRRVTSWPSLRTDITNAGGEWVDEQVVVDGNVITSHNPGDIPAFNNALLEAVNHGMSSAATAAG